MVTLIHDWVCNKGLNLISTNHFINTLVLHHVAWTDKLSVKKLLGGENHALMIVRRLLIWLREWCAATDR